MQVFEGGGGEDVVFLVGCVTCEGRRGILHEAEAAEAG